MSIKRPEDQPQTFADKAASPVSLNKTHRLI